MKMDKIIMCEICNTYCKNNYDYDKHSATVKHITNINKMKCKEQQQQQQQQDQESNECITTPPHSCDVCGKKYKFSSGLSRHKHACENKNKNNSTNTPSQSTSYLSSSMSDKEMILFLIKENQDMKTFMKEQQEHIKEQTLILTEIIPKIKSGNTIKNKFNLNIFLNEKCRDAISLCDFIKSLQITFEDLGVTKDKGLEESVGAILLKGLKELNVFKRPIHCTDDKRDTIYIKDEHKWEKDEGNKKLKDSIGCLSRKQIKTLKEWKDTHPDLKVGHEFHDDFIVIFNHICTPITDIGEKRIIKTIAKEMHLHDAVISLED